MSRATDYDGAKLMAAVFWFVVVALFFGAAIWDGATCAEWAETGNTVCTSTTSTTSGTARTTTRCRPEKVCVRRKGE